MIVKMRAKREFIDINTGAPIRTGSTVTIENNTERARRMFDLGLADLISITHPEKKKKGKKVIIYQNLLYKIGGIETADQNLAQAYHDRDITFVFRSADFEQGLSLGQTCNVIMDYEGANYECDVLILANYDSWPLVKDRVKAGKIYQQVHADWRNMKRMFEWSGFQWQPEPEVDAVLACSDTVQAGLLEAFNKPIASTVVPNILMPAKEGEFRTFLTLSRLSGEKGGELVVEMVKRLHEANKAFLWFISATIGTSNLDSILQDDKSVIFLPPTVRNKLLVRNVDYVVQLSHNESYCYTVHEALQVGTPVIGTDIPEIAKVVKNGQNGYLVGQHLEGLDIDAIFNKKPVFEPLIEKINPIWEKVLGGEL